MLLRIQSALKGKSGLPTDQFVNNLYVETLSEWDTSMASDFAGAIRNFFEDVPAGGGTANIRSRLSPTIDQNGHSVKIYRMEDATPRVPLDEWTWNMTAAPAGTALPSEVAMCLSFSAARTSGVNMARRRGRIFIGPLNTTAQTPDAFGNPRPTAAFAADLRLAGQAFAVDMNGSIRTGVHVIHSPTTGPAARFPVADYWTDDAFDTQRRRGAERTAVVHTPITQVTLGA